VAPAARRRVARACPVACARARAVTCAGACAFACACAAALLAACAAADTDRIAGLDDARAQALLVPGRTTEADARAAFGPGSVVQFRSGWATWHYEYRAGLAKGWDEVPFIGLVTSRSARPTKELVLLFDPAGTLRRYALQEEVPPPRHAMAAPPAEARPPASATAPAAPPAAASTPAAPPAASTPVTPATP
jgi:hypothetical protein